MRLLDLYCGAGGSAMGYHRAGFDDITGIFQTLSEPGKLWTLTG